MPESVAVIVTDEPASSAIELALTVKVTVGALSSLVNVILTDCDPQDIDASAPDTLVIEIVAVSFIS